MVLFSRWLLNPVSNLQCAPTVEQGIQSVFHDAGARGASKKTIEGEAKQQGV